MSDAQYEKNIAAWKRAMAGHGWYGVDLDGTLAMYEGWKGPLHIGDPIPKTLERIKRILASGLKVKIFTARASDGDPRVVEAIQDYTEKHVGVRLEVTCEKDYNMVALYDDRAVQVIPNTGERADGQPDPWDDPSEEEEE